MIKTILFQHFSTPDFFTELSGMFPQPETTFEQWREHCNKWIDEIGEHHYRGTKAIKAGESCTPYYAALLYLYNNDAVDYKNPKGGYKKVTEMTMLDVAHLWRDTLWWMYDMVAKIKPLTPEQQDLWVEKSGTKWWCYEKGNTWCD